MSLRTVYLLAAGCLAVALLSPAADAQRTARAEITLTNISAVRPLS